MLRRPKHSRIKVVAPKEEEEEEEEEWYEEIFGEYSILSINFVENAFQ
jgi:hypothetical protein